MILSTLGWFYRSTEQYSQALNFYKEAASLAEQPVDRAQAVAGQAHVLRDSDEEGEALAILTSEIHDRAEVPQALAVPYKALANVFIASEFMGLGYQTE